jgi:hypothetical protein
MDPGGRLPLVARSDFSPLLPLPVDLIALSLRNRLLTKRNVCDRIHHTKQSIAYMPARPLKTPADFGALITQRRRELGLDQASLAKRAGVSRLWVN